MKPNRFVLTPEQQEYRRLRLQRRRALREQIVDPDETGPRCQLCGLLEPHECLDGRQVRS